MYKKKKNELLNEVEFFLKIQLIKVSTTFLLMKADFNHNIWLFKPLQMVIQNQLYITWYNNMTICNLLNALPIRHY